MNGERTSSQIFSGGWSTDSGEHDKAAGPASQRSPAEPVGACDSDVRLTLPARPENVAVIRQALAALAQPLDLSRAMSDDIRLAVTEACTNVVRHAYAADDGKGIMDVIVRQRADAIEIEVADAGGGARSPDVKGPGLGLPLIAALADTVEVERNPPAGNRLKMSFGRARRAGAVGTT